MRHVDLRARPAVEADLPQVARAVSSNPDSYEYLAESIRAWPDQAALARVIQEQIERRILAERGPQVCHVETAGPRAG